MAIDLSNTSGPLTSGGLLRFTEEELGYLQSFLDRGDRVGYYMALYNMMGNEEAILQARIASFSEGAGGTAWIANHLLQTNLPSGDYPGIYYLSQEVAKASLAAIRAKLTVQQGQSDNANTGYITDAEMFDSANEAWRAWNNGQLERYFPARLLDATIGEIRDDYDLDELPPEEELTFDIAEIVAGMWQDNDMSLQSFFNRAIEQGGGVFVGVVSLFGAGLLGKRLSDYESDTSRYTVFELPDANNKVVVDNQTNKIVGIFDNTPFPTTFEEFLNTFSANLVPIVTTILGGSVPGLAAAVVQTFAQASFADFRRSLTHSLTEFDGDINPLLEPDHPSDAPLNYLLTDEATTASDTLWGSGGLLTFLHADTLSEDAGDDWIFGRHVGSNQGGQP